MTKTPTKSGASPNLQDESTEASLNMKPITPNPTPNDTAGEQPAPQPIHLPRP